VFAYESEICYYKYEFYSLDGGITLIDIIENDKVAIQLTNIEELYKWLLKNKESDFDKYKVVGSKDASDLLNFFKFYLAIKKECETKINTVNDNFVNYEDNKLVIDATNELIRMNSDGKFLRACLIALGYFSTCSSNDKKDYYLPLAAAYETFQTSILIHDDIIDNADLRRGKVTIPKAYCENFEKFDDKSDVFKNKKNHIADSLGICIGDLGFYLASKIIIDNYKEDSSFLSILNLYNKIVINTIKGEIIDVLLPFNQQYSDVTTTTEEDVMEIYRLKTAWYSIIGPFQLGMALTECDSDKFRKIEDVLYNLGIGFQIKDDILGIYGNEKEIGKSASSDISEFKQTILYSYLANKDQNLLKELHRYYGKENLSSDEVKQVKKIFEESGALDYARTFMEDKFRESKEKLDRIDFISEEYKSILYGFIIYLDLRNK